MSLVSKEIETAIKVHSLVENEFKKIEDSIASTLYFELLETFVKGGNRLWWWESFRKNAITIDPKDNKGYECIKQIVPDSKELVWFLAEEDELPFFPIYEGTTDAIVKVLGGCFAFEYYLIPKNKNWLLCENHHNEIIGVGETIENRMVKFAT